MEPTAIQGLPSLGQEHERSTWFWSHFGEAADTTIRFLGDGGVALRAQRVADVGCGEGITDLGLALKARPNELVGYDLNPTDTHKLVEEARRERVAEELPGCLRFETSAPSALPASNDEFDIVLSWSAFEHVADPPALMREIARVLRPHGVFMLQLWPFYHSEHGAHLWRWFPEGFVQFRYSRAEIEHRLRADPANQAFGELMLDEFTRLNQATLDDLGLAIRGAGLRVARLEPMTGAVSLPAEVADIPLSRLAISGVTLLAIHA